MQTRFQMLEDAWLLRKRRITESIIDFAQEQFSDRTLETSQSGELHGEPDSRVDCVRSSAEETRLASGDIGYSNYGYFPRSARAKATCAS
jgi:hypothetical protein